ncbi:HEAT repeat domain-containing protein, partial [Klebsiella pneumoniae]|nr:HEAT repeat domain-containing protein [Klebsiella pneumoniae]
HRVSAQNLLETLPNIHTSAQEGLSSAKQEIRVTAIEWLARLKNPESLPALNALLKKEKREVVRASLLTALEQLGEDISSY